MRVGVDIGGTFTDLVLEEDGRLHVHKLLSTPNDPSQAMLTGLQQLLGDDLAALQRLAHGSTVATNAILQRRGARFALITTQGFRDLLYLGRQNRPQLYALQPQLPPPLLPRERCFEIPERLDHKGQVIAPLDEHALGATLDQLEREGLEAIAVCFLFSYVNPQHERRVRDRLLERGIVEPWQVVLSSDVLPEFREYERASTVALEAFVRPVMNRYIERLEARLPTNTELRVMRSDGGVSRAASVREQAIHTALSGPAAGVIGAYHIAQLAGYERIITLDMGGTSTDVSLCDGEVTIRPQAEIDGLPLRVRTLDIETIGAGGGSIARLDAGGALRVGPESAGADPGPIIYGHGGLQPTVSDANALLGRLGSGHFLDGALELDLEAARERFAALAEQLGTDIAGAARGILAVANANIDRALRHVSVARGHDPRDFTLVAFGGAGPLHACAVAERLELPRVLVPSAPGVLCAMGLIVADVLLDYNQSVLHYGGLERAQQLATLLTELRERAATALADERLDAPPQFRAFLDARYQGQAHELLIPYTDEVEEAFHAAHMRAYGHELRDRAVEVVNLRLQAIGAVEKPLLPYEEPDESASPTPFDSPRDATGMTIENYAREDLRPGARIEGPALVSQLDCTSYVAAGWAARVDGYHNLILEQQP